ncbi:MAG: glycosyltransferase family A protein [Acidimicrobiia bacterium]|nr:glycosyltransferase family A protein [Acidimicrobiia bacterium]
MSIGSTKERPPAPRAEGSNGQPRLSVVVVVYDMEREAPRTLHSLSAEYQEGVDPSSYEVVVVDNGSPRSAAVKTAEACGDNFRYHYLECATKSPAPAMNAGIAMTTGKYVGLYVDGARIATPGLLRMALLALSLNERALVSTLAWHLGPQAQMVSVNEGYNADVEDELLESIDWPANGYDLFTISAFAGSSARGFFQPVAESNALFMPRRLIAELGGMDESFSLPGGGVVNLDTYARACALPETTLITLLGEGTFHQVHGGVATNAPAESDYVDRAFAEYAELRGHPYRRPERSSLFLGPVPKQVAPFMTASIGSLSG